MQKINEVKDEISSINNLATTAPFNAKVNEIKDKIPNTTNLYTTTALNTVDNKIPGHSKHITTSEFNSLRVQNFSPKLGQANLASQNDVVNLVKKTDFDDKLKNWNKQITSNKVKHALSENELKRLLTFYPSLFLGQRLIMMMEHNFIEYFNCSIIF